MKWFKRLLLVAVFVAVFAIALVAAGWWLARGTPSWYTARRASPQELAEAAHRAEQEVQRTLSWAQDQQAFAASSRAGNPTTHPAKAIQISLTQDELNGFFAKWDSTFGWNERYSRYLSDPQVVLEDGRIILVATAKDLGSVVSVEFAPELRDGRLSMPVGRVLLGRLPLPQSLWDQYRARLEAVVQARLPGWRRHARISSMDGAANPDAVAAAMSQSLLDLLENRAAPAVLFLPSGIQSRPRSLPVKLTGVEVSNKTLLLTVEPLPPDERQALLESIRPAPSTIGSAAEP